MPRLRGTCASCLVVIAWTTLPTALRSFYVSDTDWYPTGEILGVIAILQQQSSGGTANAIVFIDLPSASHLTCLPSVHAVTTSWADGFLLPREMSSGNVDGR
jgi:hypothetical protein